MPPVKYIAARSKVDPDFFKSWTPESVYVLGCIASDGSVGLRDWAIETIDRAWLEEVRDAMKSTCRIGQRTVPHGFNNSLPYKLTVGSAEHCRDLRKIFPRDKSRELTMPKLPPALYRHFIRGFFKGDGCLTRFKDARHGTVYPCLIFYGTEKFLKALSYIVHMQAGLHLAKVGRHQYKGGNDCVSRIKYTGSSAEQVLSYMRA